MTSRDATAIVPENRFTLGPHLVLIGGACAAALAFGILLPMAPREAVATALLIPLAVIAPVAAVSVLVGVTVLVPFEVQDALAATGGRGEPGLLFVDALLLVALLRMGWWAVRRRLPVDRPLVVGTVVAMLMTGALIWGVANGAALSEAGHETRRVMLGVGTFLVAWPVLANQPARRQLLPMLFGIGLLLGVWGLVQWFFDLGYTTSGDVGVRSGVDRTSSGRGQLQGGMYAFPVAVILAWAGLVSGQLRSTGVRSLLALIMLLNGVCLLLTFERSFWVATLVGCAFVALTSGAAARRKAIKWAALGGLALVIVSAGTSEGRTALERLASVGQVSTDHSFLSRLVESQAVVEAILQRPIPGSGFGATITWGAPGLFATETTPFVHNGYLWLAWKVGIPAAVLVVVLIGLAILQRRPVGPVGDADSWRALRIGSRASLLALMLVAVTFPVFNALGITAAMGLLVALCYSPASPDPPSSKESEMNTISDARGWPR